MRHTPEWLMSGGRSRTAAAGGGGFPRLLFLFHLNCKNRKSRGPRQLYRQTSFASIAKCDNLKII